MSELKAVEIGLQYGLGGLAFIGLLWFLRYRETVAIPKMLDTFAAQLTAERAMCQQQHRDLMDSTEKRHQEIMSSVNDLARILTSSHDRQPIRKQLGFPLPEDPKK